MASGHQKKKRTLNLQTHTTPATDAMKKNQTQEEKIRASQASQNVSHFRRCGDITDERTRGSTTAMGAHEKNIGANARGL